MRPRPTRFAYALIALAALALATPGRPAPSPKPAAPAGDAARKAVERVVERYRSLRTYHLEGQGVTIVSAGAEHNDNVRAVRFVVSRPGRMASEVRDAQYTTRVVADGDSLWTSVYELGQYNVQPMAALRLGTDSTTLAQQLDPALDYNHMLDGVTGVRGLGRDTVRTARGAVTCERYALTSPQPDTSGAGVITLHPRVLWVDPATRLVLMDSVKIEQKHPQLGLVTSVTVTRMVVAEADPALAASTFVFTPPADERRVRRFMQRSPEHEALEGQPAADFTLETLADASPVRLSGLKGRVVLLDFWATWCGPCRGWLPIVAKASHDYAAKGLSVFAVNERESESQVRAYLTKQKLDLPVLMDHSGSVGSSYRASAIPLTVVVGRDGNVVRILVGLHDEADLRDVLHEAGID